MVSYYIYGRENGFITYNPDYSREDADRYFLKMTPYAKDGLERGQTQKPRQELPEKLFFYEIRSKANGLCTIFGQSSFVKANSSGVSGDRDTVFSFQYLLNGEERSRLLKAPSALYDLLPFPANMDQVCRKADEKLPLNAGNAQLDLQGFLANREKEKVSDPYTAQELVRAFSLTGDKLSEFMYTFLQFNARERVYLMLPENTKEASGMAFSLMVRALKLLPAALVRRTGFVTYVNRVESSSADYVPFEIRHLFLANTEENQLVCRRSRAAFVFLDGCESRLCIPAELREITDQLAQAFLNGAPGGELREFFDFLGSHLREDASVPVAPVEYQALYQFCAFRRMLTDAAEGGNAENEENGGDSGNGKSGENRENAENGKEGENGGNEENGGDGGNAEEVPAREEIWQTVDLLRKMGNERAALWLPKLEEDVNAFVKALLDSDWIREDGQEERLFREYETYPELRASICSFFCRNVRDDASLEAILQSLRPCPQLRAEAALRFRDRLVLLLRSGTFPESLFDLVLDLSVRAPDLRETICSFFEQKITDPASFSRVLRELSDFEKNRGENPELSVCVRKKLFRDPEKQSLVLLLLAQELDRCFEEAPSAGMKDFWTLLGRLKELNPDLLRAPAFLQKAREDLRGLFQSRIRPEEAKAFLEEAQRQWKDLSLPGAYQRLFADLAETYLKANQDWITETGKDPELFEDWPFLAADHPLLRSIWEAVNGRSRNLRAFTDLINSSTVPQLVRFFRDKGNQKILSQAAESGQAGSYVSAILAELEKEGKDRAAKAEAKECYGDLCALLLFWFPVCTKKIYAFVMQGENGGLSELSEVVVSLEGLLFGQDGKDSAGTDQAQIRWKGYMEELAEFLRASFDRHAPGRNDKKELRENQAFFIRNVGLSKKELDGYVQGQGGFLIHGSRTENRRKN